MTTSGVLSVIVAEYVAPPAPTGKYLIEQPKLFQAISSATVPARVSGGSPLAYEGGSAIDGGGFGPTSVAISPNLNWKWSKSGGDILGSDGVVNAASPTPWATIMLNAVTGTAASDYTVDITAMAQFVQENDRWMAFRVDCPGAVRPIGAKFGPNPPSLTYNYVDGSSETLPAYITAVFGGSSQANTTGATMSLPVAMEFTKPRSAVRSCTVTFHVTTHQWSGNSLCRFFLFAPLVYPVVPMPSVRLGLAQGYIKDAGMSADPNIIGQHRYNDGTTYSDYCSTAPSYNQNVGAQNRHDPALYGLGAQDLTKLPHLDLGKWIGPGANSPNAWQVVPSNYTGEGFVPVADGIGALRIYMPHDVEAFPLNSTVPIVDGSYVASSGTVGSDAHIFMPPDEYGLISDISVRAYYRIATPDGGPLITNQNDRLQVYTGRNATTGALSGPNWLSCGGKWGITPTHKCNVNPWGGGNSGTSGGPFGYQLRFRWGETYQNMGGPYEGGWRSGMHLWDFLANNPPGWRYGGENPQDDTWAKNGGFGGVLYANQWYCVEIRVKLNSVVEPLMINGVQWEVLGVPQFASPDGLIEVYIDGMLAYKRTGMIFRTNPVYNPITQSGAFDPTGTVIACRELGFKTLWNNWFHGGVIRSGVPRILFVSGLAWSRNGAYIGPMRMS